MAHIEWIDSTRGWAIVSDVVPNAIAQHFERRAMAETELINIRSRAQERLAEPVDNPVGLHPAAPNATVRP